jgi:glutathione synthase/RimK-type ligase-like ATP-grasp enzyme
VSTKVDIATDYVVLKLSTLGADFYRLNTEDFPLEASSTIRFQRPSSPSNWLWTTATQQTIYLDDVRCIWFRRHRLPALPEEISEAHAEYCLRESDWFLRGAVLSLGLAQESVAWMSYPMNVRLADHKVYQLSLARSLGFNIPNTLISTTAEDVRTFFNQSEGNIVAKPLRLGYFDYGDKQAGVYTNRMPWENLQDDDAIRMAPVIYQELLPKLYDIRVTVVGQKLFAAAIDSQSVPSASIDWRKTDTETLGHLKHALPAPIEDLCLKLVAALGLNYGAIDLVLTPDNEYFFLEINPNGQWVWLEERLGFPISEEIAAWLFTHSQT